MCPHLKSFTYNCKIKPVETTENVSHLGTEQRALNGASQSISILWFRSGHIGQGHIVQRRINGRGRDKLYPIENRKKRFELHGGENGEEVN
jgi:hypothetical protein